MTVLQESAALAHRKHNFLPFAHLADILLVISLPHREKPISFYQVSFETHSILFVTSRSQISSVALSLKP